jgi:carbamoylphosphate synthase small subunit
MEIQSMTPNQTKVLAALKQADDWLTIKQISKITGVDHRVLHKTLETPPFKDIEISYQPMKVMNRLMDVKTYREKRKRSNSNEALKLAKQHSGIFGQLYWL